MTASLDAPIPGRTIDLYTRPPYALAPDEVSRTRRPGGLRSES